MPSNNPQTPNSPSGLSQAAAQAFQANLSIRKAWLNQSAPLIQAVAFAAPSYTQGQGTTVNLLGSATGLVRKFYIVATGTLNATSGTFIPSQPFGIANLFSNITFTDQNTRVRHNTTGPHIHMIQAARRGWVPGMALNASAMSETSGATGNGCFWGNNFFTNSAPTSMTGGTPQNFQWCLELPV